MHVLGSFHAIGDTVVGGDGGFHSRANGKLAVNHDRNLAGRTNGQDGGIGWIDNGDEILTLGTWEGAYDEETTLIDLDLSLLAGEEVQFILMVNANASPEDDNAFWFLPHIRR